MAAMARNVLASCLHLGWLLVLTGTAADLVITKTIEQSCIVDTNQGRLDLSSVAKTDGQSTALVHLYSLQTCLIDIMSFFVCI